MAVRYSSAIRLTGKSPCLPTLRNERQMHLDRHASTADTELATQRMAHRLLSKTRGLAIVHPVDRPAGRWHMPRRLLVIDGDDHKHFFLSMLDGTLTVGTDQA